mgnify:CR=1 FL=1
MNRQGDVVLITYEEQPAVYARIERIEPDVKKGWYQVTLLFLTLPAQTVTWILRGAYIQGESFTMGGKAIRLQFVPRTSPEKDAVSSKGEETNKKIPSGGGKVIPFKKT